MAKFSWLLVDGHNEFCLDDGIDGMDIMNGHPIQQTDPSSSPTASSDFTGQALATPCRRLSACMAKAKAHYPLLLVALAGLAAIVMRVYMLAVSVEHVPVTADESITVLQAKRICEGELPLLVLAQPYQFPVEAYLSAPGVHLVPRNTWGARYVSFIEGFIGFVLLMLLVRKTGALRQTWPIMLLIMFPSAYLLMIQCGYPIPHDSPLYLAAWGAMLLTIAPPLRFSVGRCLRFLLAGILCGLAFANNMLALALIVPILMVSVFQGGWRHVWPNLLLLAAGVCIGLIPYFVAIHLYPGAYQAVAGTRSIGKALSYLWEPAITVTFTRALGITPTLFPDSAHHLDFASWLFPVMPFMVSVTLLSATVLRTIAVIRQMIRSRTLELNVLDVFIGVAWLNLALFSASVRSHSGNYRYLAPAAWSVPFIIGAVYISSGKWMRKLIGAACIVLAMVNIMTAIKLTEAWGRPDFAERVVDAPDLKPAIEFLHQQGITRCVASHWQAYRINYYTDETIICSQPLNERFPGWPLPYKDQVDAGANVAYVLSERSNADFNPTRFEEHLKRMNISAQKAVQGQYSIYYGFSQDRELMEETCIPSDQLTVTASHNPTEAGNLIDNRLSRWTTHRLQENGMWIQIDLKDPQWLSRMVLIYGRHFYRDRAPRMNIQAKSSGQWQLVGENVPGDLDPFEFENGHPVYDRYVQVIRGKPVFADGVRLEIVEADPHHCWTLMKIDLYRH